MAVVDTLFGRDDDLGLGEGFVGDRDGSVFPNGAGLELLSTICFLISFGAIADNCSVCGKWWA